MPVRKIFLSSDNYNHSIEMGLSLKGGMVSLIVCNSTGKRSSHIVISLHPDDALQLSKEIVDTIDLAKKGGRDGTRS